MNTLTNQITAARDLAAAREGDVRVQEFIRAITLSVDESLGLPMHAAIDCHSRSWYKYFFPGEMEALGKLSQEELADVITGWVKNALERDILTLSNPPVAGARRTAPVFNAAAAQVSTERSYTTYTFDRNGRLVGGRSDEAA